MQAWADWDIPSVRLMNDYWQRHPPVHLLVAAYLGYQAPGKTPVERGSADDLAAMFPMPGGM